MAAKLADIKDSQAVEAFTDEITHLVRSQVEAVVGNVGLVMPAVLLISLALYAMSGQPMITPEEARQVLDKLHLLNPSTLLFAAFTGILLFMCKPALWWCLLAIPLIGVANLSVSFFLAFQLASRANVLSRAERLRLRQSLMRRVRQRFSSFFVPTA
jgi:site-specific recombinase